MYRVQDTASTALEVASGTEESKAKSKEPGFIF